MDSDVQLVILKGAPGSGKSQTGKSLAKHFNNGIRLEVDTIRQMVISVDWKNQEEHIAMLNVSANLAIDFIKKRYTPVILIDTFSGDKIKQFLLEVEGHISPKNIKVFGLYVSVDELQKRLEQRSSVEFKDFEICKRLNDDLLKWASSREILIDTTGLVADQTAERILKYMTT